MWFVRGLVGRSVGRSTRVINEDDVRIWVCRVTTPFDDDTDNIDECRSHVVQTPGELLIQLPSYANRLLQYQHMFFDTLQFGSVFKVATPIW